MLTRTFFIAVALLLAVVPDIVTAAAPDTAATPDPVAATTAMPAPEASRAETVRHKAARAAAAHAEAARKSMAGTWQITWPCDNSTVLFEQRCSEGIRDSFTLTILVKDFTLCALHAATAKMGDRVDKSTGSEPSIIGKFVGAVARINFTSAWEAKGTASLVLEGKNLKWKLLSQDGGRHWLPSAATLMKVPNSTWGNNLKCSP